MHSSERVFATEPKPADAQRYVEALLDWKQRDPAIAQADGARAIRAVGIVGVGMMGAAIAAVHVRRGVSVVVTDADQGLLANATERITAELNCRTKRPGRGRQSANRLIKPAGSLDALAQCDLVLESIVEAFLAKHQLYQRLEPQLRPATVLASNTSTIPIGRLAAGLHEPGSFCGLHFFHPVRSRPLVEVVRGPKTTAQTVAAVASHAKAIGKIPIVVCDGPGFLVNRLLVVYLNEALELLLDGATIEQIDRAAVEFGMRMGPIRFLDEIGLDTALRGGLVLREAFPERIPASPLLIQMIKAGRTGRKSGAGFLRYAEAGALEEPGQADPAALSLIAQWARRPQRFTSASILARLLLPMVLEATRILEEKRVLDPRDIDVGLLFGLGFPKSRGGLLRWADTLGTGRILEWLKPLETVGERFRPTGLLQEMARTNLGFASLWAPRPARSFSP